MKFVVFAATVFYTMIALVAAAPAPQLPAIPALPPLSDILPPFIGDLPVIGPIIEPPPPSQAPPSP
jgi:hypothetical protein